MAWTQSHRDISLTRSEGRKKSEETDRCSKVKRGGNRKRQLDRLEIDENSHFEGAGIEDGREGSGAERPDSLFPFY